MKLKKIKKKLLKVIIKLILMMQKEMMRLKINIYFLWKSVIMKDIIMKLNKIQKNKKYIQYIILE